MNLYSLVNITSTLINRNFYILFWFYFKIFAAIYSCLNRYTKDILSDTNERVLVAHIHTL